MKVLITIICFLFLFSCKEKRSESNNISVNESTPLLTGKINKDSLMLTLTKEILTSVKNKDFEKFAGFIHPELGVRFSPYAYIDTMKDVIFTADKFLEEIKKQSKFNWGSYDGTGDTIILTTVEYFNQFIYNADYLNAEKRSVNKMIGGGNSLNNLEAVYLDCDFTESYFSGFDKKFEGMDWCCIRLVFKNYRGNNYLVGVVHDQWTI